MLTFDIDASLFRCSTILDNYVKESGYSAFLFVNLFYHQPFVTSVTKTSKTGLLLFCHRGWTNAPANLKQGHIPNLKLHFS